MEVNEKDIPSQGKVNGALTTGIIGTALSGLLTLGGGNVLGGLFNGNKKDVCSTTCSGFTDADLSIEREQWRQYMETTKQYYNQRLEEQAGLNTAFNNLKQYNIDNSFMLYKYSRDNNDSLLEKINCLANKVDVMNAIRPYQDALINAKIDNNALIADFNLSRRTCRMITGELVLPSTPTVTGYASYSACGCVPQSNS